MWQTILNSLKSFLGNFLKSAAKIELDKLMPLTISVVKSIESDPSIITNGSKRDTAFSMIGKQLGDSQKDIPNSLIYLAIELGVQELSAILSNK